MSNIQLIVDGVTVYQSGVPGNPPAPTPPAQPPVQPSGPVNAVFDFSQAEQRAWSNPNGSAARWPVAVPFVVQMDITNEMQGKYLATINYSDAGAERADRIVSVSQTAGDFSDAAQWVSRIPSNANSCSVAVGNDPRPADVRLTAGRWYINVKNVLSAGDFLVETRNG